jgi:acyl-CoA thioesterase-1
MTMNPISLRPMSLCPIGLRRYLSIALLTLGSLWASEAACATKTVLVLGDSLSAGYGLSRNSGWIALLQQHLEQQKFDAKVINASWSGETTTGGLQRLPSLLAWHRPDVVVIELGANDGLTNRPLSLIASNLRTLIKTAKDAHAEVLVIGMRLPPTIKQDYRDKFAAVFNQAAEEFHVPLVPFLLAGVVKRPELFQRDHLHPTAAAQPILLDTVWPMLRPMLK